MNKWSKVKTLEDKPRSGGRCFFKYVRNIIEKAVSNGMDMCNNSLRQKGKKIQINNIKVSSTTV